MVPGTLKSVKAIGWFIEEYGVAQISMNLTNIQITPVHVAFDEVCSKAQARGIRVSGSELVGLVPLHAMLDAGRYFLRKQKRSTGVSDKELIKIAVKSMGLDELGPFNPEEKIIEYQLKKGTERQLVDLSLQDFMEETASESIAPGGGSVSAYMGSMGVALTTMVANLSAHKRGWDERWEEFSEWADKAKLVQEKLLRLVDEDTRAFNSIMEAFGLPKNSDEEKEIRRLAIEKATLYAIEVPFDIMNTAFGAFEIAETMVINGNPSSVTDAGVGVLAMLACVEGAWLNVKINSVDLKNHPRVQRIVEEGEELLKESAKMRNRILEGVDERI
jgi:glutamate formiminotransferase/formiminotetrahydrofolate cyclodeaminase